MALSLRKHQMLKNLHRRNQRVVPEVLKLKAVNLLSVSNLSLCFMNLVLSGFVYLHKPAGRSEQ